MNIDKFSSLLKELEQVGWTIERRRDDELSFNNVFSTRYPNIPKDYLVFLQQVKSCVNPSETAWFLTEDEYNEMSKSAFTWNELELQSIEAAEEDSELISEVRDFWDQHLPIMLSVKSAYAFVAITISDEHYGIVVHGIEPEYEDATQIASSFQEFMEQLVAGVQGNNISSILYDFT